MAESANEGEDEDANAPADLASIAGSVGRRTTQDSTGSQAGAPSFSSMSLSCCQYRGAAAVHSSTEVPAPLTACSLAPYVHTMHALWVI